MVPIKLDWHFGEIVMSRGKEVPKSKLYRFV